jgi:uracil-DNA glycosylase
MSALHSRVATFVLRPKPDPLTSTASYPKARMTSLKRKGDLTGSAEDLKRPKKDGSLNSFFGAPKPAAQSTLKLNSSAPEAAPIKFDKEKWVASLKDEQRQLLKLEIDTLDVSWLSHLKNDLVSPDFLSLKRFLQQEVDSKKTIFPPLEDVYSWYVATSSEIIYDEANIRLARSRHTPLHTVKVLVLGQDPYHRVNQAHGLSFSVRPPTPAPPSLVNIYKALKHDFPSWTAPPNKGGLLTPWANQGVLMLNTCLTVRSGEPNSHANRGWEKFTQKVIDLVVKVRSRGVVFLAWGAPAQKRCASITGAKHMVLKSIHPSPLAASRGNFAEVGHFKKANTWLRERYGEGGEIDWDLNKPNAIAKPPVEAPVKVTETRMKPAEEDGSATKALHTNGINSEDEFDELDDEDALEALDAVEKSGAAGGV